MHPDVAAVMALLCVPGVGALTVRAALAAADSAQEPFHKLPGAPAAQLTLRLPVATSAVLAAFAACRASHRAAGSYLVRRLQARGAQAVLWGRPGYPRAVVEALGSAAPPALFLYGKPRLLAGPHWAIVGTRAPSQHGEAAARAVAREAVRLGAGVVSGGASGVDTAAHEACIEAGGTTVVVLPQGLLTYAPPKAIAVALREGRVLLVSEFLPDMPWETHAAITRNATISALGALAVAVEPRKTGGSIRTARLALAQGKPVVLARAPETAPEIRRLTTEGAASAPSTPEAVAFTASAWRDLRPMPLHDNALRLLSETAAAPTAPEAYP